MAPEASATLLFACNILSATVIIACIILKVPQILSVLRSKSSVGISKGSVMMELLGYSIMLTYHFAMKYPLTTYFEYTFLVLQDVILVVLVLHYSSGIQMKFLPVFVVYVVACVLFAFRFLPDAVLSIAISLCLPLALGSKVVQILAILRKGDPGQVSEVSWGIAFYTTFARSVTTLVQTGDVTVLANFALSCILNFSLMSLVIYYKRVNKRKLL